VGCGTWPTEGSDPSAAPSCALKSGIGARVTRRSGDWDRSYCVSYQHRRRAPGRPTGCVIGGRTVSVACQRTRYAVGRALTGALGLGFAGLTGAGARRRPPLVSNQHSTHITGHGGFRYVLPTACTLDVATDRTRHAHCLRLRTLQQAPCLPCRSSEAGARRCRGQIKPVRNNRWRSAATGSPKWV
jgi:hypothetical protein